MSAWGPTQTERLVKNGAPELPEGYTYKLYFTHPSLAMDVANVLALRSTVPPKATSVTATIVDERGWPVASFTEVTRADLGMASVAAARHAYEEFTCS